MPSLKTPHFITALIIIGIVALVVLVAGVPVIRWLVGQQQASRIELPEMNGLGSEGARCGGPERLPCGPGTFCSVAASDVDTTYGTCVKDPAGAKLSVPLEQ